MDFEDFYDLAKYYNNVSGNGYTEKEVAKNAYEYYEEYKQARETGEVNDILQYIIDMLRLDSTDNDDCAYWYSRIASELNL